MHVLLAFATTLVVTPVSVCVLAVSWNYFGGFMSSAAFQCVLASGFYSTAPIPYWIMGTSGLLAAFVVDCGSGRF